MIYNNTVPYAFYSACSAGVAANYSDILEVVLPEIKGMKGFNQHNYHHIL